MTNEDICSSLLAEASYYDEFCYALDGRIDPVIKVGEEEFPLDEEEKSMLISYYTKERGKIIDKLNSFGVTI